MKTKILTLLAPLLVLTMLACSALSNISPVLGDALARASDAALVLDLVDDAAAKWFAQRPNPELAGKIDRALDDCRLGLSAATRALEGAKSLEAKDVDAAYAQFRQAWRALEPLLKEAGILGADGKFAATSGQVAIPRPIALEPLAAP